MLLLSALGVFLPLFLIYRATLMPTVIDQDSGELVAACHVLGVAHPTGYPLWVLLGRAFDFLPVGGTSAYRVALLSAVSSAGSAALVTVAALGLAGEVVPALAAGLAFGLWFPTWSQAVRAEVYGLTALLVGLALLALVRWDSARSPRALGWLALTCGFVSMHHRTAMLAVAPALAVAVALTHPRRARTYLGALGLLVAPFAFYAYVPMRALARPPLNWTDPSTLERFLDHVLATQYQHFAFSHTLEQMWGEGIKLRPELLAPGVGLSVVLAALGLPLIGWGWWRWARQARPVAVSLAVGGGLLVFWVLQWGETSDLKVFFSPLGEVLAICGAMGLAGLGGVFASRRAGRAAAASTGIVVCGLLLGTNWARADLSNMWGHRDRWVAALSQMGPDAIFLSDFDVPSFATLYLQNVEGLRRDVTLLRAVRLPDDWYVALIEDAELRAAAREAWDAAGLVTTQLHDRTALCAYYLAKRFEGRRPVYCLHAPPRLDVPGPPYFVGLSEDLVHLQFALPDVTRRQSLAPRLAQFPGDIKLASFGWEREEAGTGEMVGFRVRWRLGGPPPPVHFAVGLRPEGMAAGYFARKLLPKGRFIQGFPLVYGLRNLGPSPEGTVYEQRAQAIVPTNAPGGTYRVAIALGPPYASHYEGWVEVGAIRIQPRPRPSNPP